MIEPETYCFARDRGFPNSPLPVLVYRRAVAADADAIEQHFARHGWSNAWRNGVFPFHHFHSNVHEVLGVAAGEVVVALGGPSGQLVRVRAGDAVVIPAGVGHCNRGQSPGLLLVGAYPGGGDYDVRLGEPGEYEAAARAISTVQPPGTDPLLGASGPLPRLWNVAGSNPR